MTDPSIVDLAGVEDPEDPRIAEAADTVVDNLEALQEALGLEVAGMLFDAIADRLDALITTNAEALEAEAENEDEDLLEDDDAE